MNNINDIDKIINSTINTLSAQFEDKLHELGLSQRAACDLMGITSRGLSSILNGTAKQLDVSSLAKVSEFLGIDHVKGFQLYLMGVDKNESEPLDNLKRNKFIVENFDLVNLKKTGFINSINKFDLIEDRINTYFGFTSIFEYKKINITPAFKSTKKAKSESQTRFWVSSAIMQFSRIANPNVYKRTELIKLMPSFRDWSLDPGAGLIKIAQSLYQLGVTLIFQQSMAALQIKGATIPVNDKPCIVLSDFGKSYPSLWFALIHELFHVIFDWESIRLNNYHLSIDGAVEDREIEADTFATDYLMPHNFENILKSNYTDLNLIKHLSGKHKIHPSIILSTYGTLKGIKDTSFWILTNNFSPKIIEFGKLINMNDWKNPIPAIDNAMNIKHKIQDKS